MDPRNKRELFAARKVKLFSRPQATGRGHGWKAAPPAVGIQEGSDLNTPPLLVQASSGDLGGGPVDNTQPQLWSQQGRPAERQKERRAARRRIRRARSGWCPDDPVHVRSPSSWIISSMRRQPDLLRLQCACEPKPDGGYWHRRIS